MRQPHIHSLPDTGFVRLTTVLHYIPVSKSKLSTMIKKGEFPIPIKIGHLIMWKSEDVRAYMQKLVDETYGSLDNYDKIYINAQKLVDETYGIQEKKD